jgi:hypothetical protein
MNRSNSTISIKHDTDWLVPTGRSRDPLCETAAAISAWLRVHPRSPLGASFGCYIGETVRCDLTRYPMVRWIIVTAVAAWLLGCGAEEYAWHLNGAADTAHIVVASVSGAVNADHTHCEHGLSPWWFESSTAAVLSRWAPAFLALGTVAAAAFLGLRVGAARQTRRGPPRGLFAHITGQVVLTRFCIARR